jgi:NodT family efflux transporter outer membrane factor (OMF) lipoprotein
MWELDVWGKFRRGVQTGVANLQASVANYDDILVSLTAEVARTYLVLRIAEERLAVARENVKLQERALDIARARFEGGTVTELDVAQAKSLLRGTEAALPQLEAGIRQAKNGLAILLGKLPGEIDIMLGEAGTIPAVPAAVAVGIPADLMRRRPDIRLAERRLAAQSARIGFAKADLFPHFTLFGSIGWSTSSSVDGRSNNAEFSDLFRPDSLFFTAGPAFNWDIFNYGRITNRVRVQDARFQQLAVNYENTVLRAAREVEDAMVDFLRSKQSTASLTDAVAASKRSVNLSLLQYREGIVDYQRVIDSQRFLTEQQDTLVSVSGDVDLNLVALYKALGGGWQIRESKAVVSGDNREEMVQRTNWGKVMSADPKAYPPSEEVRKIINGPLW